MMDPPRRVASIRTKAESALNNGCGWTGRDATSGEKKLTGKSQELHAYRDTPEGPDC